MRDHLQAVTWSAIIFLMGIALGLSAVQFDERAASIILPNSILNSIYSGQMWTGSIFSVVPAPVASTFLFTSNISVALLAFAGGLSFGLITTWILFQNGFMLGVVFKLCADYGLLGALLAFIASHGVLEISAIILAGAGGFVDGERAAESRFLFPQRRAGATRALGGAHGGGLRAGVGDGRLHRGVHFAVAFSDLVQGRAGPDAGHFVLALFAADGEAKGSNRCPSGGSSEVILAEGTAARDSGGYQNRRLTYSREMSNSRWKIISLGRSA